MIDDNNKEYLQGYADGILSRLTTIDLRSVSLLVLNGNEQLSGAALQYLRHGLTKYMQDQNLDIQKLPIIFLNGLDITLEGLTDQQLEKIGLKRS